MNLRDMTNDTQNIIMKSHDVKLDVDYAQWIAELKVRYRSAQVKAAVRENGEKLPRPWKKHFFILTTL